MLSNMPPPQSGYYMGGGSHNHGYSHPMTHPPHVSGPGPYPPGFFHFFEFL